MLNECNVNSGELTHYLQDVRETEEMGGCVSVAKYNSHANVIVKLIL